ncbi:hypothetical protein GUITHDRAFT_160745 [Guillardia theta CCMP2712]|uniref:RRM domain-containing protein n=1 Tax=Guillardia theta (strain CCMP2712) TaxID=905079 RepID=L1K052_GUITC|nr:hypothetical protein GUITHDRAFT_160745 [Guillardia theta CCMP2712]EKX53929.1 hypothetical protein GUITHDRAFT_160745 [Guillardia theta CCMP2712]|eukprot:XP_005840909.1 hypothetical protein GUITHDRAFT_160745 [Guillardia theta CCMP2712]
MKSHFRHAIVAVMCQTLCVCGGSGECDSLLGTEARISPRKTFEDIEGREMVAETAPLLSPAQREPFWNKPTGTRNLDVKQAERYAKDAVVRDESGDLYELGTPLARLGKLGTGVGLYFYFVFYAGLVLGLMSVLTLPVMISNFQGSYAFDPAEKIGFPRNLLVASTLGNRPPHQPLLLHSIMDFLCSLAFLFFLIYYRRRQLLARKEIETKIITAADYSILVSNLPENATREEILDHFGRYGQIEHVYLCYKGYAKRSQLMSVKEKAEEDLEQFDIQLASPLEFPEASEGHTNAQRTLDEVLSDIRKHQLEHERCPRCCGLAFVTFKVKIAPQPSDILWENLEVKPNMRALRVASTSVFSLFLLLIATGLIAAVNGKHFFLPTAIEQGLWFSGLLNFLSVIIIIVSNVAMFVLMPVITRLGKLPPLPLVYIMWRLWLFQVLNTLLAALVFWDASRNESGVTNWAHWFADGGSMIVGVIVGDAVLMNLIEFFRPFDVILPRKMQGPKCLTQKRLNRVYEAPELSLGMRYQMILKHFTLALALGSAMPLNYWLITILCIVTFWIDKFNVLRLYKKPALCNDEVANVATVYIAPLSLLLHLCIAPFFYTVVATCPTQIVCPPSSEVSVTYVLLGIAAAVLCLAWQPMLYVEPEDVHYHEVRCKDVSYSYVEGIEKYQPEHDWPANLNESVSASQEIGISVF